MHNAVERIPIFKRLHLTSMELGDLPNQVSGHNSRQGLISDPRKHQFLIVFPVRSTFFETGLQAHRKHELRTLKVLDCRHKMFVPSRQPRICYTFPSQRKPP